MEKLLSNMKKAFEYLNRNNVLYMGMIFPIQRGTADIIYAERDGVFIRETESDVYFLVSDTFNRSKELTDGISRQSHICVYRKDIADYLYEKYNYKKHAKNLQAVYTRTKYVEQNSHVLDIQPLTLTHLGWVHRHNNHLDSEYLKERLKCGAIYGGYLDGELCGSVGIHAEGAMGILKVLKQFRKQGFASELVGNMVNILLGRGDVPFSQIEHDNEASIGLHKKLGFEISTDTLYRLID